MVGRGVSRISVSVPPELLRRFDEAFKRMGYENRSKAIQKAMHDFVTESKWVCKKKGTAIGAVIMVFNRRVRGLEEELTDLQHERGNVSDTMMHIHLDEDNCLEIIPVRGSAVDVRRFVQELETRRGVKQLKLALVTP